MSRRADKAVAEAADPKTVPKRSFLSDCASNFYFWGVEPDREDLDREDLDRDDQNRGKQVAAEGSTPPAGSAATRSR